MQIPVIPPPKPLEIAQIEENADYSVIVSYFVDLYYYIEAWHKWYAKYKELTNGYNQKIVELTNAK